MAPYLAEPQRKLYDLIYRRFVASQMKPAIFAITNVEVTADKGVLKAQGKILKFDGYRRVLAPRGKQEDFTLPALAEKQPLSLLDLLASQHFTQPPPRYNEASLVKALEKAGIGRPSTYASIIKKIQDRHYVEQKDRRFHATKLGMIVTDKLIQHFPNVMDLKFTGALEEKLDQIEGQHLDLLPDRDPRVLLPVPVEVTEGHVLEGPDPREMAGREAFALGELEEPLHGLVARLEDEGDGTGIASLQNPGLHGGGEAVRRPLSCQIRARAFPGRPTDARRSRTGRLGPGGG